MMFVLLPLCLSLRLQHRSNWASSHARPSQFKACVSFSLTTCTSLHSNDNRFEMNLCFQTMIHTQRTHARTQRLNMIIVDEFPKINKYILRKMRTRIYEFTLLMDCVCVMCNVYAYSRTGCGVRSSHKWRRSYSHPFQLFRLQNFPFPPDDQARNIMIN